MTWPDPTGTGTSAASTIDVTDSRVGVGAARHAARRTPAGAGVITFTSTSRESVLLGLEYVYQAVDTAASDYTPTYSLPPTGDPTGMTINLTAGLVTWMPTSGNGQARPGLIRRLA